MAATRVFHLSTMVADGSIRRSATGFTVTRQRVMDTAGMSTVRVRAHKIKTGDFVFFSSQPTATAELVKTVVVPLSLGDPTKINGKSYTSIARFDVIRSKKLR